MYLMYMESLHSEPASGIRRSIGIPDESLSRKGGATPVLYRRSSRWYTLLHSSHRLSAAVAPLLAPCSRPSRDKALSKSHSRVAQTSRQ